MDSARRGGGRPLVLLAVAALLIVSGLVAAISAPGAPPHSNKADAYGGPVTPTPTNPKTVGECNKYWGATNPGSEARNCKAIAKKNAGLKACAKKKGAAKKACQRKVKAAFKKELAAIARMKKAEKACNDTYQAESNALDPDSPDYESKSQASIDKYNACITAAHKS